MYQLQMKSLAVPDKWDTFVDDDNKERSFETPDLAFDFLKKLCTSDFNLRWFAVVDEYFRVVWSNGERKIKTIIIPSDIVAPRIAYQLREAA